MIIRRDRTSNQVPYRPGLDGLRALAVTAVVLYHADVSWLRGGFLGVDVFFAISGYLICSLLLAEWGRTGSISYRRFWGRRARRLLPAVVALMVGAIVISVVVARDSSGRLRGDLVAALAYLSNWWQIVAGQSYFEEIGRPPLLRHLWSLAVEEQFYLVFPPILAAGMRRTGGSRRKIAVGAVVAGGLSCIWMAHLWQPDTDPSRVFFGTDTRAVGLCAGVALACVWAPGRLRRAIPDAARILLDAVGVLAVAALAVLFVRLGEFDPVLYHGGFAAVAIASAIAIAVAVHPASRLGHALSWRPLNWIGTRSYAIYLWHWPVFMVTRPGLDVGVDGLANLVLRLAITALLAEASWRLVEQPFRNGTAGRLWANAATARPRIVFAGIGTAVVLGIVVTLAPAPARPELLASAIDAGSQRSKPVSHTVAVPAATAQPAAADATTIAPPPTADPMAMPSPQPAPRRTSAPPPPTQPAQPVTAPPASAAQPVMPEGSVLAIGDSVMATARQAVLDASGGRATIDAVVGRQVDSGLDVLQRYRESGELANVSAVVIHLGTNGPMTARHFERLAALVEGVPRVVVVNVRVPRRWEAQSNTSIRDGVPAHERMRIADWYSASAPKGVVGNDGVHPTPSGARVYARVIVDQLAVASDEPAPSSPPPSEEQPPPSEPPPSTEPTTTTTEPSPSTTEAPPPPPSP